MRASETSERPPQTEPTLRAIAMPADSNPHGDIFGGWLLSRMGSYRRVPHES
jgi:acyl-CoA thioesterase YciA